MYYHRVDSVTAFVLAGGKSSRMGQDKAFLRLGRRTLLERALDLARNSADGVFVVGSSEKFAAFGPVVEDVYPGHGPLGGIHAGLTRTSTDLNLMLAVDLPFIHPLFLEYLVARAHETAATVVLPKAQGRYQPLCALYRRSFVEVAEQSLLAGGNKIDRLFGHVQTRVIEPAEMIQNGFTEEMFRNLNTPEDWKEASAHFTEEST
jgi:molybdopterin-guanine dinucleotide biosynthesis protein A